VTYIESESFEPVGNHKMTRPIYVSPVISMPLHIKLLDVRNEANDAQKMQCIWEGDIRRVWDTMQLCCIVENLHFWILRHFRPWVSSCLDGWVEQLRLQSDEKRPQKSMGVRDATPPKIEISPLDRHGARFKVPIRGFDKKLSYSGLNADQDDDRDNWDLDYDEGEKGAEVDNLEGEEDNGNEDEDSYEDLYENSDEDRGEDTGVDEEEKEGEEEQSDIEANQDEIDLSLHSHGRSGVRNPRTIAKKLPDDNTHTANDTKSHRFARGKHDRQSLLLKPTASGKGSKVPSHVRSRSAGA